MARTGRFHSDDDVICGRRRGDHVVARGTESSFASRLSRRGLGGPCSSRASAAPSASSSASGQARYLARDVR